jgi:hypothetical protein
MTDDYRSTYAKLWLKTAADDRRQMTELSIINRRRPPGTAGPTDDPIFN